MGLTKISTGGVKDDAASQAKIADEAIDEARLQVSNAGSNGQFLSKQSGNTGGLTWASVPSDNTKANLSGADFTGEVALKGSSTQAKFYDPSDTSHSIHFKAPSLTANSEYTLPTADGSANQVLKTSGSGALSWTTISAAPTITATADGAIAANKPVRVNEDGTISEIKNTNVSAATGSNTDIPHQYQPQTRTAVWISSSKFIFFWIADNNNDKLNAAVGSVSGTTITYGTRIEVSSNTNVKWVSAAYDSQSDAVICAYNTSSRYVVGLTVSGTTITVNGTSFVDHDNSEQLVIACDNKGGFLMQWINTSDQWYGTGGTISSTGAIACGSSVHIANSRTSSASTLTMGLCYDKDSDSFVSLCRFSGGLTYQICTRSGTTMTVTGNSTPPQIVASVAGHSIYLGYDEVNKQFLIVYRHSGNDNIYYATPKMGSGNTSLSTGGSGSLFTGKIDVLGAGTYDKGSGKAFFMFADDYNSADDVKLLTITLATNGSASATSEQLASHKEQGGQTLAANGEGMVFTAVDKSDNSDVLTRVKQLAVTTSNLKADGFIGFSTNAISDSASGTINVLGNTATQSGLTPSKKYYVQKAGTLSTGADDPNVVAGIALTSTKLLITG